MKAATCFMRARKFGQCAFFLTLPFPRLLILTPFPLPTQNFNRVHPDGVR